MTTPYRLRLFFTGFLLGCVLVYFLLFRGRDRSYWLPQKRVKEQLQKGKLVFTAHAQCRIECRNISPAEVEGILKNGEVNFSKSQPHDKPCPVYVMEGISSENRNLRIVFAACDTLTKVITVMNLNLKKDACNCP